MSKHTEKIFGLHSVKQVLKKSPEKIFNIWLQNGVEIDAIKSILGEVKKSGLSIQYVPKTTLDKMTKKQNHQGVVIEIKHAVQKSEQDLDQLLNENKDKSSLYLVLDSIQDPHNLGACLRTADAVGVTAVLIPKDRAAKINETVRKVASGAAESVTVISVVNLVRALKKLKEAGVWIVGTMGDTQESIYSLDLTGPTAIVMGGEGKGMRASVTRECDYLVSIPMVGQIESLNVSVAAGVSLYEVLRQRNALNNT